MNRCASVRKRGSTDQCLSRALYGHTLCGRHARIKSPTLWSQIHNRATPTITRVQARVRGWLVRRRLALAGPGVLCRKGLANDEELMTFDDAKSVHPFDYFAFEEAGKIWWFSFDSIWKWCAQSLEPVNPYTKVRLAVATQERLRELWAYRYHHRDTIPSEPPNYLERLQHRWNVLCQIFRNNGFIDVHPQTFLRFSRTEYSTMFTLLHQDLLVVLREKDPQRDKILRYVRRAIASANEMFGYQYILQSTFNLLLLLSFHKEPYSMVFTVLSAFYRC